MRKSSFLFLLISPILFSGCGYNKFKNDTREASNDAYVIGKTYESFDRDLTVFRESVLKLAYITSSNGPMDRNVRFDAGNQILKALECDTKQSDTWKSWAKRLTSDVDDPMHPQVHDELYQSIVKDLSNSYQNIKTKGSSLQKKTNELSYKLSRLSGQAEKALEHHTFMLISIITGLLSICCAYVFRNNIVSLITSFFKK